MTQKRKEIDKHTHTILCIIANCILPCIIIATMLSLPLKSPLYAPMMICISWQTFHSRGIYYNFTLFTCVLRPIR